MRAAVGMMRAEGVESTGSCGFICVLDYHF